VSTSERLGVFQYVTVEKAELYRSVMRLFVEAKESFGLYLRPGEVHASLQDLALPEVEHALQQLSEWGNLEPHHDTSAVATIEEFHRPRWLYQMSVEGEAAEQAIAAYHDALRRPGELQTVALSDIRSLLGELFALASGPEPDAAKIHLGLRTLGDRFEELTSRAQAFIGSLQRAIDLRDAKLDSFIDYKRSLIDYLNRFVGQLLIATADIAGRLDAFTPELLGRMHAMAAEREVTDSLKVTDAQRRDAELAWQRRWEGLRRWFVAQHNTQSQAEILRRRALSAIPALLRAIETIHERRVAQSDRATDLRTLARWFAETESGAQAHQLWRAAFGLAPARHLRVDTETQDLWQSAGTTASTPWSSAPPLRLSPRLRATGSHVRRGRPESVVDHGAEKVLLTAVATAEAAQIEAARAQLATGERTRLSQLGTLDVLQFSMFQELLGEALTRQRRADDGIVITSSDGSLEIVLEPTGDGVAATIVTEGGTFSGMDHYLTIRDLLEAP